MRTLKDLIDAGQAGPYQSRIVESRGVAWFRCRCGRLVPADMMLEVQPPGCGEFSHVCGHDRFRCDGCWTRWVRERQVCPDRLRHVTGQPVRGAGKPW